MYVTRFIRVLLATLSLVAVAHALHVDNVHGARDGALVRRQEESNIPDLPGVPDVTDDLTPPEPTTPPDGGGGDDDDSSSDDDKPTSSSTTATSSATTSSTSSSDDDVTTPAPTPTTTTTTSDTPGKPDSSSTSDKKTPDTTPSPDEKPKEPITETHTHIVTTTNDRGEPTSFTTESTVVRTPGLSDDDSGGSSGMSTGTRNTVIGVVVGVGGAIVLGALGFVAWRIWGRKKTAEESDDFAPYEPMEQSERGNSPTGGPAARNPFQQTLETYHAPTQVNASSNF